MEKMSWEQIMTWVPEYVGPVGAIAAFTVGFMVYYFVIQSPKMEARVRGSRSAEEGQIRWVLFQRIWGGAWLGIPALVVPLLWGKSPADYGMLPSFSSESLLLCGGLSVLVIVINLFRAGSPANLVNYPQIRAREWDLGLFLKSSGTWVIYLLGYELMFRGLLLYGCLEGMGIWPAVAINASLYAFAHFFKGIQESVAALPFGIIICGLTLYTGDFLVAFVVHCALALSNQTIALRAHPEMRWVKKR